MFDVLMLIVDAIMTKNNIFLEERTKELNAPTYLHAIHSNNTIFNRLSLEPKLNLKMLSSITRQASRKLSSATLRSASTLIIAEPTNDGDESLAPATLSVITAAQKIHSGDIALLSTKAIDPSNVPSCVTSIINTNQSDSLAESISNAVHKAQEANSYSHILVPSSKFGSNVIARAGALLGKSPITDIIDVLEEDTFVRPMYAGNCLAKVQSTEDVKVLSVRSTAFDKAEVDGSQAQVSELDVEPQSLTEFVSANVSKSDRPELSSASVVVSGGRGLKNGENFVMLEGLADKLGGAVGASRAAGEFVLLLQCTVLYCTVLYYTVPRSSIVLLRVYFL